MKNGFVLDKKSFFLLCLILFVVFYLFISMFNEINIGWRHVLPIYPIIYILIAVAAYQLVSVTKNRKIAIAAIFTILLVPTAISALLQFPKYIGYSNELLPVINKNTNWPKLTDSNLDWGQDLYRLSNYAKANPSAEYSYQLFTNADLGKIGMPLSLKLNNKNFDQNKCKSTKGQYLVISYQIVYNDYGDTTYNCLRGHKPYDVIGSSLLVFKQ